LAPLFVSSVSALTILYPTRQRPVRLFPSFALCSLAIFYGVVIGAANHITAELIYGFFNWYAPVLFGMHLAFSSREYPQLRQRIERDLSWGALVMGFYGVYQFFIAPKWDTYWLENISIGLIDPSFGQPAPMKIRVWSTLNGPGPFANVMVCCLLVLFVSQTKVKLPASIGGYLAFLLSMVRTGWLDFILGVVVLLRGERPSRILKLAATAGVMVVLMIPIVQSPDLAPMLGDRFSSLGNLHGDESFRERQDMYRIVGGIIRDDPYGHGLLNNEIDHNLVVDSGILILLLQLGWMGTALFLIGIVVFFFSPARKGMVPITELDGKIRLVDDRMPMAMKALCIAYPAQLVGGQVFVGVTGAMFWMAMGLTICAEQWRSEQDALNREPSGRIPHLKPRDEEPHLPQLS